MALGYFGVSDYISVPIAAVGLVAMTATGSFRRWELFIDVFVVANFLVIPLAVFSHPKAGPVLHDLVVPGVRGGFNSTSVLLIIAIVGNNGWAGLIVVVGNEYWPAPRESEVVVTERRTWNWSARRFVHGIIPFNRIVAQELVRGSVKLAVAGARDDIDLGGCIAANSAL